MYPMRPVQPPCLLAARPYDDSSRPIRGIRKVPEIAWEITLRRLSAPVRRPDDGLDGYPLPRVPPAAGAACAAVHGDGACERRDPRRSRPAAGDGSGRASGRSEEHTSELQSLMRASSAVFCLKKKSTTRE